MDKTIGLNTQTESNTGGTSALPFLGFCFIGLLIITGICFSIWYMISPRLTEWGSLFNYTFGGVILSFIVILSGGFFLIAVTVLSGIDLLYPHGKKSVTVKLLFPIAVIIGKIFGISRDKLRASFVCVNNAMTKSQRKRLRADRLLVLLPHCLQIDICNRNITHNIDNCEECGRCPVGGLKKIMRKLDINVNVVNGGTLARKKVAEFRPTGIIAVACERDLTLGIQDVYPIPVMGVINDRPNGPCHNTSVNMDKVQEAIHFFTPDLPAQ